jgi:hypothetical protein
MWRLLKAELNYHSDQILYVPLQIMVLMTITVLFTMWAFRGINHSVVEFFFLLYSIPAFLFYNNISKVDVYEKRLKLVSELPVKKIDFALYRIGLISVVVVPLIASILVSLPIFWSLKVHIDPLGVLTYIVLVVAFFTSLYTISTFKFINMQVYYTIAFLFFVGVVFFIYWVNRIEPHEIAFENLSSLKLFGFSMLAFSIGAISLIVSNRFLDFGAESERKNFKKSKVETNPTYIVSTNRSSIKSESRYIFKALSSSYAPYLVANYAVAALSIISNILTKIYPLKFVYFSSTNVVVYYWAAIGIFASLLIRISRDGILTFLLSSGQTPKNLFSALNRLMIHFLFPHLVSLITVLLISLAFMLKTDYSIRLELIGRFVDLLTLVIILQIQLRFYGTIQKAGRLENNLLSVLPLMAIGLFFTVYYMVNHLRVWMPHYWYYPVFAILIAIAISLLKNIKKSFLTNALN